MRFRHVNQAYATIGVSDALAAITPFQGGDVAAWFAGRYGGRSFGFGSARAALNALLRSHGIGPGDEVVLCGFTCLAVPEAVVYAGATPIYADLASGAWASGADEIDIVASDHTRAVIVQHTYGIPTPMADILDLARQRGWLIIEDCALALGSGVGGIPIGCEGDAAIFSFEMTKTVTGGWGGIAVARNPDLAAVMDDSYANVADLPPLWRMREMFQVLVSSVLFKPSIFGFSKYVVAALYRFHVFRMSGQALGKTPPPRWSYRLPRFQSALVQRQLVRLETILARRVEIADSYRRWLDATGRIDVSGPRVPGINLLRFPMLTTDPEQLVIEARRRGFEIGRWFDAPISPMPEAPESIGYIWGRCPRAEWVAQHIVNLPLDPRMTMSDVTALLRLLAEMDIRPLPLPCHV